MCILMATTAHPKYSLILISNRDEFYERKTHLSCLNHDDFILSPFDMSSNSKGEQSHGTWCGVNKEGKVGVILNLRLSDSTKTATSKTPFSRGAIPIEYLQDKGSDFQDWNSYKKFNKHYPYLSETGSFNFFYGDSRVGAYKVIDSLGNDYSVLTDTNPYMVISNDLVNSSEKWGKVKLAEDLLHKMVLSSLDDEEDIILEKCFALASNSVQDQPATKQEAITSACIYVPPLLVPENKDLGASLPCGKYYGTRSQIVTLVSEDKKLITFVEHVVHDSDAEAMIFTPEKPKSIVKFHIKL
ncbi:LAFE_0F04566g1_1 [Lachancea fermentati]|uniref:LAFE_0F04566g1_1 n=1 Tax=Lachancea fermentati TaxID=4955 RepID=A0A1G4MEK1_LACFM|nr:LAFE_0F04566g1_1 [Lachancea fermentati]